MDALSITLLVILNALPRFAVVLVLAAFGKWMLVNTLPFRAGHEMAANDNAAAGYAVAGSMIGLAIALSGALFGTPWVNPLDDLLHILVYGLLAAALMRLSFWINDKAILYKFCVKDEIVRDHNRGTGWVIFGSAIATGFMLRGVLSGYSPSWMRSLLDIGVYFTIGQLILILGALLYTKTHGYDVHEEIERDNNEPAGMSFGGFLLALGYIAGSALEGATHHLLEEITASLLLAGSGIAILLVVRILVDKLLMPRSSIVLEVAEDQNPAAGALAAASFLLVAILFTTTTRPPYPTPAVPDPVAAYEGAIE